jgi:hypothetical protein
MKRIIEPPMPDWDAIPDAMKQEKRWLLWRSMMVRNKRTGEWKRRKVPCSPITGKRASAQDRSIWLSLEEAQKLCKEGGYRGIGFALGDGWAGIDMDSCITKDGDFDWGETKPGINLSPELAPDRIIETFEDEAYFERSPSGNGLHGIMRLKGKLPPRRRKLSLSASDAGGKELACYDSGRFFTVTGRKIAGNCTMADVTDKLVRLHSLMFPQAPVPIRSAEAGSTVPVPALEDVDLIERASHAKDGDKFQRLWEGSHNGYPSQSEADLALCNILAFWTGRDVARMDQLFRQSGLMRDKWEREDYRDGTIARACESTVNTYSPHKTQTGIDAHRNGTTVPAIREPEPLAVVNAQNGSGATAVLQEPNRSIRPRIFVNNRQLHEVSTDVLRALNAWNSPPRMFTMGERKVQIFEKDGGASISDLTEDAVLGCMTRSADYIQVNAKGERINVFPPKDVARDLRSIAASKLGFPPLASIAEAPAVLADGRILSTPGYDPDSRLFYAPKKEVSLDGLPEHCDGQDARDAREFIENELFHDFRFADDENASLANTLAALLTPIVRHATGLSPMGVFDANSSGAGKGLLVNVICLIATGRRAFARGLEGDEAEIRKAITAALLGNQANPIVFDNVTGTVKSSALDRVLTMPLWTDRVLGYSKDVDIEQKACWMMTSNNISLGGDLSRRVYRIRFDTKSSRPFLRTDFRHDNLLAWTLEHRNQILIALLTMARAWWQAKCPASSVKRLGSFEEWTRIVGGILEFSGSTGFLSNFEAGITAMDSEDSDWSHWLREVQSYYPNGFTVPLLLSDLTQYQNQNHRLRLLVPNVVSNYLDGKANSAAGLGMVLKFRKARRFLLVEPDSLADRYEFWLTPLSEKRPIVWTVDSQETHWES